MSGATMNSHTCAKAVALVPTPTMAGPSERAGLTETPVTLMPTMWIAVSERQPDSEPGEM